MYIKHLPSKGVHNENNTGNLQSAYPVAQSAEYILNAHMYIEIRYVIKMEKRKKKNRKKNRKKRVFLYLHGWTTLYMQPHNPRDATSFYRTFCLEAVTSL